MIVLYPDPTTFTRSNIGGYIEIRSKAKETRLSTTEIGRLLQTRARFEATLFAWCVQPESPRKFSTRIEQQLQRL
jgi:hypothetical protein